MCLSTLEGRKLSGEGKQAVAAKRGSQADSGMGVHGSGTRTKRDFGSGTQNFGSDGWRTVSEPKIIGYPIISVRIFGYPLPNFCTPSFFGKQFCSMLIQTFLSPFLDNCCNFLKRSTTCLCPKSHAYLISN